MTLRRKEVRAERMEKRRKEGKKNIILYWQTLKKLKKPANSEIKVKSKAHRLHLSEDTQSQPRAANADNHFFFVLCNTCKIRRNTHTHTHTHACKRTHSCTGIQA